MTAQKIHRVIHRISHRKRAAALLAGLLLMLTAQSGTARTADPWEGMNRRVFGFNEWADGNLLRPTAVVYTGYVGDMANEEAIAKALVGG